jgi:hypothetical protein
MQILHECKDIKDSHHAHRHSQKKRDGIPLEFLCAGDANMFGEMDENAVLEHLEPIDLGHSNRQQCSTDNTVPVPSCRGATVTVTGRPLRCLFFRVVTVTMRLVALKNRDKTGKKYDFFSRAAEEVLMTPVVSWNKLSTRQLLQFNLGSLDNATKKTS